MKSEKDFTIMRVKVPTKLRVRSEPSIAGRVVALLANKAIVEVSKRVDTPEGSWYKVDAYIPPVSKSKQNFKLEFGCPDMPFRFEDAVWVYAKYLKKVRKFNTLFG